MSDWKIRVAVADDATALARCIDAAYAIYESRELNLPPVSEGVADNIATHRVWVAEREGAIVGGLIVFVGGECAQLTNIAVDPDFSGLGIGRALMEQAERHVRELGFHRLRLTTHKDLPENIQLYQHLGWSETARSGTKVHMSKQL